MLPSLRLYDQYFKIVWFYFSSKSAKLKTTLHYSKHPWGRAGEVEDLGLNIYVSLLNCKRNPSLQKPPQMFEINFIQWVYFIPPENIQKQVSRLPGSFFFLSTQFLVFTCFQVQLGLLKKNLAKLPRELPCRGLWLWGFEADKDHHSFDSAVRSSGLGDQRWGSIWCPQLLEDWHWASLLAFSSLGPNFLTF